jgi:hypothetical protein
MSYSTLRQPLRPAGPTTVDLSTAGRGGAVRLPVSSPHTVSPRITLHFQSRASILTLSPSSRESGGSHRADGRVIVHPVVRFLITAVVALLAVAGACVVAFGTHPALAKYPSGMEWITLARRLQWPMTALSLALCVTLIGMVIAGRRRAAWLLVLAPVLFLFYQRFAGDPFRRMAILENPTFVPFEQANFPKPESPVVGIVFEGQAYAYPTGCLSLAPVIVHAEGDKRLMLMYSPYAGRAQAFVIDTTIKPRELDIVSMPANAMLLYNSRIGQFINAFTGATLNGERPEGFRAPVETRKTTWRAWCTEYPDTRVLATALSVAGERPVARFPSRPVKMDLPADAKVLLLPTNPPVVVEANKLRVESEPLNLTTSAGAPLLMVRRRNGGGVAIFERVVQKDLFPRFERKTVTAKPEIALMDSDTGSFWSADGRCLEGPAKGEQLRPLNPESDLPYATLKSFYPKLELLKL